MIRLLFFVVLFLANQLFAQDRFVIKISKSSYTLELFKNDIPVYSFPCVFGNPVGDKYKQGDRKTPVGSFKIVAKYPHASWAYFLWFDYPNTTSWKRFNERKKKGILQREDKIGGSIGIHGVPEGRDYYVAKRSNWTLGCVSISRKNIMLLYNAIPIGTEVQIFE
jgi:murein L,D-transpeptidase YafK